MSDEELNEAVERLKFGFGRPSSASDFLDKYGEAIHHRIAALTSDLAAAEESLALKSSVVRKGGIVINELRQRAEAAERERDAAQKSADLLRADFLAAAGMTDDPEARFFTAAEIGGKLRAERDAAVRRAEELEGVLDSITDQAVMSGKVQTELLHKASKLLCK